MNTNRGAWLLLALCLTSSGLAAWNSPAAGAAPATDTPLVAQAPTALLSGRLAGRTMVVEAGATESARVVMQTAIADFGRSDDVVRMMLQPAEMAAYRAEDHLELAFSPPRNLELKGLSSGYTVRAARLLVPLNQDWTRPDWFFYCKAEGVAAWGVYRWRGADPSQVEALRRAARRLMP